MGSHCSFCKDSSDTKSLEVEEQKRERIKIHTVLNDEDHLSLRSFSIDSSPTPKLNPVTRVAKRYLTLKYLKISALLSKSPEPYKLLFGPMPSLPEESKNSSSLSLFSHLYLKDPKLKVLPAVYLNSSEIYEGQWNLTLLKPEGFGILLENNSSKYIGNFLAGAKHGHGRSILLSGQVYEGEFQRNSIQGNGRLKKSNGLVYTGSFKDGKEHGFGIIECEGEEIYAGEFSEGFKHGKGKLKISEGSFYSGEFFNNFMQGFGTYVWPDGKKYEGTWKENLIHGEGKYQWPEGNSYVGCYKDGGRDGYGIFKWNDGREYRGEWKAGVMHGVGSYSVKDKDGNLHTVKGQWENGKKVK
jgi:hypothetical protein